MPLIFISTPTKRKGLGTEKALSYNKGPVTMLWDQVSGVPSRGENNNNERYIDHWCQEWHPASKSQALASPSPQLLQLDGIQLCGIFFLCAWGGGWEECNQALQK